VPGEERRGLHVTGRADTEWIKTFTNRMEAAAFDGDKEWSATASFCSPSSPAGPAYRAARDARRRAGRLTIAEEATTRATSGARDDVSFRAERVLRPRVELAHDGLVVVVRVHRQPGADNCSVMRLGSTT
jgi:hypothetical protein